MSEIFMVAVPSAEYIYKLSPDGQIRKRLRIL